MKISKEIERVERILLSDNKSRDSDLRLLAVIWYEQIILRWGSAQTDQEKDEIQSIIRFLELFQDGELANPETVMRCRRKLQQHNESLRGLRYEQRNKDAKSVRQEMLKLEFHGRGNDGTGKT